MPKRVSGSWLVAGGQVSDDTTAGRGPHPQPNAGSRMLRPCRGGFTLIECLLAGVILAIFGTAMATTIAQALAASERAGNERLAAMYLDEVLTRVNAIGPATLSLEGPVEGRFSEQFAWAVDIQQQTASDLYHVTATVTWPTARGTRSASAYTLMYDPLGSRPILLYWEDLQ